jgi:hypothetical protein
MGNSHNAGGIGAGFLVGGVFGTIGCLLCPPAAFLAPVIFTSSCAIGSSSYILAGVHALNSNYGTDKDAEKGFSNIIKLYSIVGIFTGIQLKVIDSKESKEKYNDNDTSNFLDDILDIIGHIVPIANLLTSKSLDKIQNIDDNFIKLLHKTKNAIDTNNKTEYQKIKEEWIKLDKNTDLKSKILSALRYK